MSDESHQVVEEVWDKKKIAIGVAIFLLLAGGAFAAKSYVFPSSPASTPNSTNTQSVQGIQAQSTDSSASQTSTDQSSATPSPQFSLPSADDVQQKIQQIQKQIIQTNVVEIATSSPQVQDILKQIEALPQVPANAAKEACINLCNKL